VGDGAGDFLDPPHKPPSAFGLDDGVVALLHDVIVSTWAMRVKLKFRERRGDYCWLRLPRVVVGGGEGG
jgi:hypothetical protein